MNSYCLSTAITISNFHFQCFCILAMVLTLFPQYLMKLTALIAVILLSYSAVIVLLSLAAAPQTLKMHLLFVVS